MQLKKSKTYKEQVEILKKKGLALLLLGTEEANRITNEDQQRRYIERMDEYFGEG